MNGLRLMTCRFGGAERVGLLEGETVGLLDPGLGDMVALIETGAASTAKPVAHVDLAEVEPCAPVRRFRRDILCTGWNYWDHFEEGRGRRDGQEVDRPVAPTFFTKGPDTVIGPRDPIAYDARISAKWDYEVELALVIGRTGRSIPRARAMEHVFGVFLANDISQRDLQRRHGGQWLKGKSIDATMPMGPWITTPEGLDLGAIRIECEVNGKTMQSALVAQMAFPIDELIAELSFGMTLRAGDVIITGTPAGVGNAQTPPLFLKEGDEVVCRGTGLGELRNRLVAVDLYGQSDLAPMEPAA